MEDWKDGAELIMSYAEDSQHMGFEMVPIGCEWVESVEYDMARWFWYNFCGLQVRTQNCLMISSRRQPKIQASAKLTCKRQMRLILFQVAYDRDDLNTLTTCDASLFKHCLELGELCDHVPAVHDVLSFWPVFRLAPNFLTANLLISKVNIGKDHGNI